MSSPSMLRQVQDRFVLDKPADDVRNICVIAHVDHGKSTLTDSLISANGILSSNMAGELRYMDNRPDEQDRGITMKSSGISLLYHRKRDDVISSFMINVIDSPGHVDFSSEVSAAIRLSDGAIVVVDAIEGLCVQTEAVLRQALAEHQKLILFINKVDRLILELDMGPDECFSQLRKLVESVNAFITTVATSLGLPDAENAMFDPTTDNVLFGSAIHGWAFTIGSISKLWAAKLGVSQPVMAKVLWGDYSLGKGKKVVKKAGATTIFEQFALAPIYEVYQASRAGDFDRLAKITAKLGLKLSQRDMGAPGLIKRLMVNFLPIAPVLLAGIVDRLPSPLTPTPARARHLVGAGNTAALEAVVACDPSRPDTIAHVAKLFVQGRDLDLGQSVTDRIRAFNINGTAAPVAETTDETFLAFTRVFSGTLRLGDTLLTVGHHLPEPQEVTITGLYAMMGKDVVPVPSVPAGLVCGVAGISHAIYKSATLSSQVMAPMTPPPVMSHPVIRVAVEPLTADGTADLNDALTVLQRGDPTVSVAVEPSGEMVVIASGEVHLEQCLADIRRIVAPREIVASTPIVQFRETLAESVTPAPVNLKLPDGTATLQLTVGRVPESTINTLVAREEELTATETTPVWQVLEGSECPIQPVDGEKVVAIGPKATGTCVLTADSSVEVSNELIRGFIVAAQLGPMCGEALHGVHVHIASLTLDEGVSGGMVVSMVSQATRRGVGSHRESGGLRIMEPLYRCGVVCGQAHLGGVHSVLAQRRAEIEFEDIVPGTADFNLRALLPVAESFGFTTDLRTRTSGTATPQLVYAGYRLLDEDPFRRPTADELEEWGEEGSEGRGNVARRYVDGTRRRKGMAVEELLVKEANKQRTISRKR